MQEPFMTKEFCDMMNRFIQLKYIEGIPTFDGKRTYFWSNKKFDSIKKQYLVDENIKKPVKYFFIKQPATHEESFKSYHKHFRNQLRKAKKQNLILEIYEIPDAEKIRSCYDLYKQNIERLNGVYFPFEFFQAICDLSYSQICAVKKDDEIVSIALLLGNLLFIQASNAHGRQLCANNLLYDSFYQNFENEMFFLGTSFSGSGHYRFKKHSGAKPIPVAPTTIDLISSLSFLRKSKFIKKILSKITNNKKIFKYFFPY